MNDLESQNNSSSLQESIKLQSLREKNIKIDVMENEIQQFQI